MKKIKINRERVRQEELNKILDLHEKWLYNEEGGKQANFSFMDLSGLDLRGADFRHADLRHANLAGADLRNANLANADLRYANLISANLSGANLAGADLTYAKMTCADFTNAKLDPEFAEIVLSSIERMNKMFERTKEGWIVYKSFGEHCPVPKYWKIKENSQIGEKIDMDRDICCSYGINVGTLDWCKDNCEEQIYKLLVPFDSDVCVPFWSDGKVRISKAIIKGVVCEK